MRAPVSVSLEVNGTDYSVPAHPNTPLLYVLRNDLGLVGARYGCGAGYCGACMVLVDGKPIPSCDVSVETVGNAKIVTIEGLVANGLVDPVYRAFLDLQAAQCGYCIPGIMVRAVALLESVEQPTRSQVAEALKENLCRCGAHTRIIAAVQQAAVFKAQL